MKTFFFAPESPRPLALVRIGLGLVFLYDAAVRWPFAVELYSSAGLPMPLLPGTAFEPRSLSPGLTVLLHSLLVFALVAVVIGWQTRLSLWTAFGLTAWLGLLDGPGTFKKFTVIGLHMMFLLSFSGCGNYWSVDAWLRRDQRRAIRLAAAWPRRLLQLLLCGIYFGAAITKLRLPEFAAGDLLEFSLLDDQWGGGWLGLWLSTRPRLLILASMSTLLFELLFPFLVWVKRLRRPLLIVATLFHLLIGLMMQVATFSPVMFVLLWAFLKEGDLHTLPFFRRTTPAVSSSVPPGRPLGSVLLYFTAAAITALAGWQVQRTNDWYGVWDNHPLPPLASIPRDEVDAMLAQQQPPYEDYVHRFEIGSRIRNFRTFGEQERFRPGMTVHALARFLDQHPPFRLDWLLIGPDGQEIERITRRLDPSVTHAWVGFELTPVLPPGQYEIVLQIDGYDAAQRSLLLAARDKHGRKLTTR